MCIIYKYVHILIGIIHIKYIYMYFLPIHNTKVVVDFKATDN